MGTIGAQELILIFLVLGVPAVALAAIILIIVLTKRAHSQKNASNGRPEV